jgi:uncharacterized membrane protein
VRVHATTKQRPTTRSVDTDLTTKTIRPTALRPALISYLFGTAMIALTVNIVASLAHS